MPGMCIEWRVPLAQESILSTLPVCIISRSPNCCLRKAAILRTMNDFRERPKSWTPDSALSETTDKEVSWKNFDSSMNAISFGFVATAILIFMFLIMAIFEHILRPRTSILQSQNGAQTSFGMGQQANSQGKLGTPQTVPDVYAPDFSVLMPGNRYPTYIAQPAPLPCPREGIRWPSHDHDALPFPQPCTDVEFHEEHCRRD